MVTPFLDRFLTLDDAVIVLCSIIHATTRIYGPCVGGMGGSSSASSTLFKENSLPWIMGLRMAVFY